MNARVFIATTGNGLARAERGANGAWSVEFLLADRDVRCLAADPLNSQIVYAGTQGEGVLRSTGGGETWHAAGLAGHIVKAVAVSRAEPGAVYAGVKPPALFVSRDGGTNWNEIESFRGARDWWWLSYLVKSWAAGGACGWSCQRLRVSRDGRRVVAETRRRPAATSE